MSHRAVFTHNDLDGLTCALLARVAMPTADVYFCDYTGFPDLLRSRLRRYEEIWIADISLKAGDALLAELEASDVEFCYFDHHASSDDHTWMAECRIDRGGGMCAADVVKGYLEERGVTVPVALATLCDYTHDQDLWIRKLPEAQTFNDILGHMPVQTLFDLLSEDPGRIYQPNDAMAHASDTTRAERDWSLELARRTATELELPGGGTLRAVCCWGSASEVGDAMGDDDTLVALLDLRNVGHGHLRYSLRTRSETVSAHKVAEQLGGGGHAKAAGAPLEIELLHVLTAELARRVHLAATQASGGGD